MTRLQSHLYAAILVLLLADPPARCQNSVIATSRVSATQYCRQPDGSVTLFLDVRTMYTNTSESTLLLPFFTRLGSYAVFHSEADVEAGHPALKFASQERTLEASKLSEVSPPLGLFQRVALGATVERKYDIGIALITRHNNAVLPLGRSYVIQLQLQSWPGSQRTAAKLSRRWRPYGALWSGSITNIVRLNVEAKPRPVVCGGRVD